MVLLSPLLTSCTGGNSLSDNNTPPHQPPLSQSSVIATNEVTTELLKDAYSEERLAEDIYTKMVAKYPQFTEVMNIINSEEKHSEQVGRLLDARAISRPTDYGVYTSTYDTLSKMIDTSLTQAIEVGVMVEVGDIDHLLAEYKKVEDADIRRVSENIGGGSFNHLRAFLRLANENNYTVTTDYARYMTSTEVSSTGPLKYKMTDLLKSNNLPTYGNTMGMGNGTGEHN